MRLFVGRLKNFPGLNYRSEIVPLAKAATQYPYIEWELLWKNRRHRQGTAQERRIISSLREFCGGAAALTIAAAVIAVLVVREIAVQVLQPDPAFTPLSVGAPIVGAAACTAMAIYVFVGMVSYPNPVRTWRKVAAVVLVLSFLPNVLLATSHMMGEDWPEACALMTMHVVVWAICVTLLPSLVITKQPPKTHAPDRPLSIL